MAIVAGKLITGDGVAIEGATIQFKAELSSNVAAGEIVAATEFSEITDASGNYSIAVNNGAYVVTVRYGSISTTLGTAYIDASTPSPIDVLELVAYQGITPDAAQAILDQAVAAKNAAEAARDATLALAATEAQTGGSIVKRTSTGGVNATSLQSTTGALTVGTNDASNLSLKTNNSTRVTVTSDGKILYKATTITSHDINLSTGTGAVRISAPSAGLQLNNPSTGVFAINSGGGHSLALGSNDTERARITSDGNVGIGTTAPIYDLQIGSYGVDADSTLALASTTTGTGSIRFGDGTSGTDANSGVLRYDHSDNSMHFLTTATERARITSTGNLLVGTTTDNLVDKLQVQGSVSFRPLATATPTNNGDLTFEATSNTTVKIKLKGSDGVVRSATLTLA